MDDQTRTARREPLLDEDGRRVVAAALAGAALGSWPAFTLGVWGVVFFEQHLALWAAATSAFLALGYSRGPRVWRRPDVLALLLPTLWIVLAWILPVGGTSGIYQALFWLGVIITIVGLPALAAFLVRLIIPSAERLQGRERLAVAGVVATIMLTSFLVGTQHPRVLTCEDFTISGNHAPENCSSGTGSTVR
ncbi:hypothetical protein [Nocardioides sp.]|uniref:hypothetical protein n=1 Tax=Nocardioides sp. TaxID=35761 RepID=UPI00378324A3